MTSSYDSVDMQSEFSLNVSGGAVPRTENIGHYGIYFFFQVIIRIASLTHITCVFQTTTYFCWNVATAHTFATWFTVAVASFAFATSCQASSFTTTSLLQHCYSRGGYVTWFNVACLHTVPIQQDRFQCLIKA